jgi:hypothetical protein
MPNIRVDSVHTSCDPSMMARSRENETYSQAHARFVLLTEIRHIGRLSDMNNSKGAPYYDGYGG